jgi:hypothetical protein
MLANAKKTMTNEAFVEYDCDEPVWNFLRLRFRIT